MQGRALLTRSRHLDKPHARLEFGAVSGLVDRLKDMIAVNLLDGSAFLTTEKNRPAAGWGLMQATAGEIGVFALETMHDARIEKGIEGPVYGDRSQPRALLGQPIQDLVGPDTGLGGSDFLEHLAAQVREPDVPLRKNCGGAVDRGLQPFFVALVVAWVCYHGHPLRVRALQVLWAAWLPR